jgi:chemotaxis protein MotA
VPPDLSAEPFLQRSIGVVADGLPPEEIEGMLVREIEAMADRHARGISVLRRAGEVAPAMGLIGTLVGLVQMLGSLNDPSAIGPSMAIALLTTLYGAFLSSVVLLPLAVKLERNSDDERLMRALAVVGAVSIARQESSRRLEMLLNTMLPPAGRVGRFDE